MSQGWGKSARPQFSGILTNVKQHIIFLTSLQNKNGCIIQLKHRNLFDFYQHINIGMIYIQMKMLDSHISRIEKQTSKYSGTYKTHHKELKACTLKIKSESVLALYSRSTLPLYGPAGRLLRSTTWFNMLTRGLIPTPPANRSRS